MKTTDDLTDDLTDELTDDLSKYVTILYNENSEL